MLRSKRADKYLPHQKVLFYGQTPIVVWKEGGFFVPYIGRWNLN